MIYLVSTLRWVSDLSEDQRANHERKGSAWLGNYLQKSRHYYAQGQGGKCLYPLDVN